MKQPVVNLRALREAKGLSLREAGERMAVHHLTLWRAEQQIGQPRLDTAKRIADFYGLEVFAIWPLEQAA